MQTFNFRVLFSLLFTVLLISTSLLLANEQMVTVNPPPSLLKLILLAILAIYEVIVRIIPSVGNYSIIAFIIDILKKISDALNRTKKSRSIICPWIYN